MTPPILDVSAVLSFLKRWLSEGPWCLTAIPFDRSTGTITKTFYPKDGDEPIRDWLVTQNELNHCGIYFIPNMVNRPITTKARREDMAFLTCLHVDIDPRAGEDIVAEQTRIRALALSERPLGLPPPSLIIFSGGGFQLLWKLAHPEPINGLEDAERLKRYNVQIEHLLGGDHCHDVCRLLRLPGTVNWPTPKKLKVGREPVLAQVVEFWDERIYSLDSFTPAPDLQDNQSPSLSGSNTAIRVEIPGNIRRLQSVDELGETVSGDCKVIIVQGDDPDNPSRFRGDRSRAVWYVACELVRCKIEDEVIFSILTDPGFGISAHILDQPNSDKYAKSQIEKAKANALDPDLSRLNDRFFVVKSYNGRCVVVEETIDPETNQPILKFQSVEAFHLAQAPHRHQNNKDDKSDTVSLSRWWFTHVGRREFEDVVFVPNRNIENHYNCWRGFTVKAIPGDCSKFLDHIKDNLCKGNEEHYTYLLNWMAFAVQHPQLCAQVAIVLKGRQGVGKSFFAKTFGHLFGRHYTAIRNSAHLVGQFNAHLQQCVVLFGDEIFNSTDKKHESVLKGLVTEEELMIERKGIDPHLQKNRLHLILASNERWAVPAGLDDRRFFILDVGDQKKCKRPFFDDIEKQMTSGGYEALLHMLMTRDISEFDITNRPETAALQEEKLNTMGPVESWWYDCLVNGEILITDIESNGWPSHEIPQKQLYQEINNTLPSHQKITSTRMGQIFQSLIPPTCRVVRPRTTVRWRAQTGEMIGRPRCFIFPPLAECRAFWDKRVGKLGEWPVILSEKEPAPF